MHSVSLHIKLSPKPNDTYLRPFSGGWVFPCREIPRDTGFFIKFVNEAQQVFFDVLNRGDYYSSGQKILRALKL